MIAWAAIALAGLTMASALAFSNALAESKPDGRKADEQVSQRDIDALSTASVLYVATVRKDGDQSTRAPVWFTSAPDHLVLIHASASTCKANQFRRGSPV